MNRPGMNGMRVKTPKKAAQPKVRFYLRTCLVVPNLRPVTDERKWRCKSKQTSKEAQSSKERT
jgi:hypothetical protein